MGNGQSGEERVESAGGGTQNNGSIHPFPVFRRTTGALGLSKSELERRCKASGLYPSCQWDERAIRRLVGDGKLAARLRGSDTRKNPTDYECPICFLHYSQTNQTTCCQAIVCTECYLQIRPQKEKYVPCPFCNASRLHITLARSLEDDDVQKREAEEQKVIEATIRARSNTADNILTSPAAAGGAEFGAQLERHNSSRLARTRSNSTTSSSGEPSFNDSAADFLAAVAVAETGEESSTSFVMTPEERREIEQEMRAQHNHPLSLRMQAEADARRYQNDQEYYRSAIHRANDAAYSRATADLQLLRAHGILPRGSGFSRMASDSNILSGSSSSLAAAAAASSDEEPPSPQGSRPGLAVARDWNEIVDAFGGAAVGVASGDINSIDELVVIEAAILLSMEEDNARRRQQRSDGEPEESASGSAPESAPPAPAPAAAAATPAAEFEEASPSDENTFVNEAHAAQTDDDDEVEESNTGAAASGRPSRSTEDHMSAASLARLERRRLEYGSNRSMSSTHFGPAGNIWERGVTECDQMAMAIALSLRDSRGQEGEEARTGAGSQRQDNSSADEDGDDNEHGQEGNEGDEQPSSGEGGVAGASAATAEESTEEVSREDTIEVPHGAGAETSAS